MAATVFGLTRVVEVVLDQPMTRARYASTRRRCTNQAEVPQVAIADGAERGEQSATPWALAEALRRELGEP
jgi:hypothetical protein